jgi:hypothetical protein
MFLRIRTRLSYANVAMTLALVFTMTGGAYAAKHYLITSTKQISPRVISALKGAAGPAGPEGKTGAPGSQGPQGPAGTNGVNGINGESVTIKPAGKECKEGGTAVTVAGKTEHVCNGSPWTAGGTLPKGATERGQWAMSGNGPTLVQTGISFTIPLSAALPSSNAHFIGVEEGSKEAKEAAAIKNGECTGTYVEPGATSGNLCVFINPASLNGPAQIGIENAEAAGGAMGTGVSGAVLGELYFGTGLVHYDGSWVVTG